MKIKILLATAVLAIMVAGCGSSQKEEMADQNATLRGQLKAVQAEKSTLTTRAETLQAEKVDLAKREGALQEGNKLLTTQVTTLRADITALAAKVATAQTNEVGLSNQVVTLQGKKTTLEKRANALQTENSTLKSQVGTLSAKPTNSVPAQVARINVTIASAGMQLHLIPNTATGGNGTWFNANGMPGGVPSLLVNEMNEVVTIHMQQVAGPYTIITDLARGTNMFKLAPGQYIYTSELKDGSTQGPDQFTVDGGPSYHFFKGTYHNGGVDIRPEKK